VSDPFAAASSSGVTGRAPTMAESSFWISCTASFVLSAWTGAETRKSRGPRASPSAVRAP
jgi:hypothetical protein